MYLNQLAWLHTEMKYHIKTMKAAKEQEQEQEH